MADPPTKSVTREPRAGPDDVAGSARLTRHARERQIARVLTRHGTLFLGRVLASERPRAVKASKVSPEGRGDTATPARELRLAFEELGPTFIKLGQLLSTRADLLPLEYQRELATLQDAAPPSPANAIRQRVETELAGGIAGAFADFDPHPLAAGSVGEAHAAVLHDGTLVVVKVRRPGVVELIERDLEIIVNLAARASRRSASAAAFDVLGLAQEFASELRGQLDYVREACNAERFAVNFADERDVRIPRVFWELTTSRVITLERLGGMKVTDRDSLAAAGVDRGELARNAALVTAKMVFVDGFFHGDPHPGNFFVEDDGTLGIIDFGIVGSLDEGLRGKLRHILIALERRDPKRLATAMIALSGQRATIDRAALEGDVGSLVDSYVGLSVGEIGVAGLIRQLLETVRRHRLQIPKDLALLFRTFLLEEGVVEQLDPQFRLFDVLAPYARQHLFAGVTRAALLRRLQDAGVDFAELLSDLPDHAQRLLSALEDGGFDVHLRATELEPMLARAERLGNRIAVSVLLAAVINAVAQIAGRPRRRAPAPVSFEPQVSASAGAPRPEPHASSPEPVRPGVEDAGPMPDQLSPRHLRRRLFELAVVGAAIATVVLAVPGLGELRARLAHASLAWLALAPCLEALSVLSYVVLFRAVFCPRMRWRVSGQIAMSELAANSLLPASGAGGLALGAWALNRGGMSAEHIGRKSVAMYFLTSLANVSLLIAFASLYATGVLEHDPNAAVIYLFGALAAASVLAVLAIPLILRRIPQAGTPDDRVGRVASGIRFARRSLVEGVPDGVAALRHHPVSVLCGSFGTTVFDLAVLYVAFRAIGASPPVGVLVLGYLIGMLGGNVPVPGGIGGIDAGLIATLTLFHQPLAATTVAVLTYHAVSLWVPALLGSVAFLRLRRTLQREERPAAMCMPLAEPIGAGLVRGPVADAA